MRILFSARSALAFIIISMILFSFGNRENTTGLFGQQREAVPLFVESRTSFANVPLEAKAAFVYDVSSGETLFSYNAKSQLPLASLAKIMTVYVANEILSPRGIVTISQGAIAGEGDTGLHVGERFRAMDLSRITLISSSNDGARSLAMVSGALLSGISETSEGDARIRFTIEMNRKARALGLSQTYFVNETGLDESTQFAGAYASAHDVALLIAHILKTKPGLFTGTEESNISLKSFDEQHTVTNTNIYTARFPGLIASKTGFTDIAGGNLAVAFEAGPMRPIIIVVLGSTQVGRFTDAELLADEALFSLANKAY